MFAVGHGLLYGLSTLHFFLELHCLQAQQVWCAAAPTSPSELVLVETKRLWHGSEGARSTGDCWEPALSSSYLGINPMGSSGCLPGSYCFICIDEVWRDIPKFVWQAHISGSFSN